MFRSTIILFAMLSAMTFNAPGLRPPTQSNVFTVTSKQEVSKQRTIYPALLNTFRIHQEIWIMDLRQSSVEQVIPRAANAYVNSISRQRLKTPPVTRSGT
jgi:hypothetical protein